MSWRKVLALGGLASAIAVGCTVTVGPGSDDAGFEETGGSKGTGGSSGDGDASTGGKSTGGKASTGGSGGTSTGGKGGTSTGGKAGAGTGGKDAMVTECMPDKTQECDYCVETKCCQEWLDCVNDADCLQTVDGNPPLRIQAASTMMAATSPPSKNARDAARRVRISSATSSLRVHDGHGYGRQATRRTARTSASAAVSSGDRWSRSSGKLADQPG
jgi:hypothetical protein